MGLQMQFASAWVDLSMNMAAFNRQYALMTTMLARIPRNIPINVNLNTAAANAAIAALQAQVAALAAQIAALPPFPGGGGAGRRGGMGQFGVGVLQGLGMPFSMNPAMAAGQAVGMGVSLVADQMKEAVGVAMSLESQFATLTRVSGMTAGEIDTLKRSLMDLSVARGTATSLEDLVEIATQVTKAGVTSTPEILKMTRAIATLKVVTPELSAEELSISTVQVLKNFKLGTEYTEGFVSALAKVDAESPATAKQIFSITNRLSGVAGAAGATIQEILALSGVIAGMGARAEAGSTAVGQMITQMAQGTDKFAEAVGLSTEEFAKAYRESPVKALKIFLDQVNKTEDTVAKAQFLEGLGIKGQRSKQLLLQLANQMDGFKGKVAELDEEFRTGAAGMKAMDTEAATTASTFVRMNNAIMVLRGTLGGPLLGPLATAAEGFTKLTVAMDRAIRTMMMTGTALPMAGLSLMGLDPESLAAKAAAGKAGGGGILFGAAPGAGAGAGGPVPPKHVPFPTIPGMPDAGLLTGQGGGKGEAKERWDVPLKEIAEYYRQVQAAIEATTKAAAEFRAEIAKAGGEAKAPVAAKGLKAADEQLKALRKAEREQAGDSEESIKAELDVAEKLAAVERARVGVGVAQTDLMERQRALAEAQREFQGEQAHENANQFLGIHKPNPALDKAREKFLEAEVAQFRFQGIADAAGQFLGAREKELAGARGALGAAEAPLAGRRAEIAAARKADRAAAAKAMGEAPGLRKFETGILDKLIKSIPEEKPRLGIGRSVMDYAEKVTESVMNQDTAKRSLEELQKQTKGIEEINVNLKNGFGGVGPAVLGPGAA